MYVYLCMWLHDVAPLYAHVAGPRKGRAHQCRIKTTTKPVTTITTTRIPLLVKAAAISNKEMPGLMSTSKDCFMLEFLSYG